jgi:hypothetical protein
MKASIMKEEISENIKRSWRIIMAANQHGEMAQYSANINVSINMAKA